MKICNYKRIGSNRAGVTAVIVLILLHIGACATTRDEAADNAQITQGVRDLLAQRGDLGPPDQIYVQTLNHVVYLTGFVSAGPQRTVAGEVARQAPGVTRVVNTIAVIKG
jgi:osmotically-inducible protein OsmY